MRGPFSRAAEFFNYVEVGLWPAIGIAAAVMALRRRGAARRRGLIASVTLFAFGASDWAENATGGEWWHPWWLLLWKAACVGVLLEVLFASRPLRARGPGRVTPTSP
jgi:hypothetical protein